MVFFLLSPGVKILSLKKIFYQKDASRIKEEGKKERVKCIGFHLQT
jgi:hypothetical protein